MPPNDKKGKNKKDVESKNGFVPRKKKNHSHDDDDSLDSRGNIRGLIDYSCDSDEIDEIEEESDSYHPTESISSQDKKRKAVTRSRSQKKTSRDDKITKYNRIRIRR